mmetsp:Transcript_42026/g.112503  ORF Transcript_42026/g.112503 Transcript_42026/m.112503 type:complete len:273 (-) Transcript_42026:124-942(-)
MHGRHRQGGHPAEQQGAEALRRRLLRRVALLRARRPQRALGPPRRVHLPLLLRRERPLAGAHRGAHVRAHGAVVGRERGGGGQRRQGGVLRRGRRGAAALRLQRRPAGGDQGVHGVLLQPLGGERGAGRLQPPPGVQPEPAAAAVGGGRGEVGGEPLLRHGHGVEAGRVAADGGQPDGRGGHLRRVPAPAPVQGQVRVHLRVALAGDCKAAVDGHPHRAQVALRIRGAADQHLPGPVPGGAHARDAAHRRPRVVQAVRGAVARVRDGALHPG